MASKYSYLLRTAAADGTSYGGFRWPLKGAVEAPDWDPSPTCGGGLHGLLWGEGDGSLLSWATDARWQVVRVLSSEVVAIDGGLKAKVPRGTVVHSGSQRSATDYLQSLAGGQGRAIVGATTTAGYKGAATAGYKGAATAGDGGTATAGGYGGTATAGYKGTATTGDYGTAIAGYMGTAATGYGGTATTGSYGTATAGVDGTATTGSYGTATAGVDGTATAGNYGTATAGNCGTATTGSYGTATTGSYGTATAGEGGIIQLAYYSDGRKRIVVGYIGEDGLLPDVAYQLTADGKFERVKEKVNDKE